MNQSPDTANHSLRRLQRSLIAPGLSCLAGIGLLGSGLNLAQAAQTGGSTIAPNSEAATTVAPEQLGGIAAPDTVPIVPEVIPPAPSAIDNPSSSPDSSADIEIPRVQLNPSVTPSPGGYEAPSTIILTERSSGCKTVLERGQGVPGELCATSDRSSIVAGGRGQIAPIGGAVAGSPLRVAVGGFAGGGGSTWQSYYKVTPRPQGRIGNGNVRLLFPLPIPAVITSVFGWRVHPITGDRRFHSGTDLGAPLGTPVLAAYAGRVAISDFLGGYGLTVALDHQKGTQQTLYAHLSEIFVKPGEWVPQGTVIGRVGSTGNSTGPHLHFEFRQATSDGWVALDAGMQLEYALAQLVRALQVAQAAPKNSRT